jgi:hypothetical protein
MAELNFPSNPSVNQQYVGPNGITYTWDGDKWEGQQRTPTPVITGGNYVLPAATATQLGGIKVGSGLLIDNNGVLTALQATVSNTAPINPAIGALWFNTVQGALLIYKSTGWQTATENLPQGGETGDVLIKNSDNNYDASWTRFSTAEPATKTTIGVVTVGDNINVTGTGTISVPVATAGTLGVVKPGANVSIDEFGAISVSKGAGINTVSDIPDVNTTAGGAALNDGALLIYNAASERWDTVKDLRSNEMDGGFF